MIKTNQEMKDAYWQGYRAGNDWHMGAGLRPENPYTGEDEDALWSEFNEGVVDAGADA